MFVSLLQAWRFQTFYSFCFVTLTIITARFYVRLRAVSLVSSCLFSHRSDRKSRSFSAFDGSTTTIELSLTTQSIEVY